jgi:hypothetical protein
MRMSLKPVFLAAVILALSGAVAVRAAEGPADNAAAIKAQIRRLNAEDLVEREEAERALLSLGLPALPFLKEAAEAPEQEIAARAKKLIAKLSTLATVPAQSYSDIMPADSIFFWEVPNTREALDKLKGGFWGKFWQLPAVRKALKGHYDAQVADDQKMLDSLGRLGAFLDGKALIAIGSPDTAEATELDPPFVYVLETKQPQALEVQLRNLFEATGDPPRSTRPYGPFTIQEHITAQTVFGPEGMVHSLTQKGIESFLDHRLKRPEHPLTPLLAQVRALLPQCDEVLYLAADGFPQLVEAGQLIDEDQLKLLNALGFVAGSTYQSVLALNDDGAAERVLLKLGGGDKNDGLLAVLTQMAAAVPPPAQGTMEALDLIPWQAALLVSFNGETSKFAAPLAKAFRALDSNPIAPPKAAKVPQAANQPAGKPAQPKPVEKAAAEKTAPAVPAAPPVAPAPAAAAAAPGAPAAPGARPTPTQPPGAEREAPPLAGSHVARVEKIGLKLEQIFEQVQGPVQVAIFMRQVEKEAPQATPIAFLVGTVLKEPALVQQSLDAASIEQPPRFKKEILNGGMAYFDTAGDKDLQPGFWMKGNYFAFASERDLLELSSLAAAHAKNTERFCDRADFKNAPANQKPDRTALISVWAEAGQLLEMPYQLAKIDWEDNADSPWPDYAALKTFLQNKPVNLSIKALPEGLQGIAQTPLGLLGTWMAFHLPLKEAGL